MKIKQTYVVVGFVVLVSALFFSIKPARAANPWKWLFDMKTASKQVGPSQQPVGAFFDNGRKRFYIADSATNSLHSFDKKGAYVSSFSPPDGLSQPYSMARDETDLLWVVEKGRNSLTKIDNKAKKITKNSLTVDGRDVFPGRMIYLDTKFYVLDKYSGDIVVFDRSLQAVKTIGCSDCQAGFIDFAESDGLLYGLARTEKVVYKYDLEGALQDKIKLQGVMDFPFALEADSSGRLYVLDRHAGSVNVFGNSGKYKYKFLNLGHTRKELYYPEDLFFDPFGRLCIIDSGNGRVVVFGR